MSLLPFKIARRYFFSRNKSGRFQIISIILGVSLGGYIVGTAALIIVLSVFNGFEQLFGNMFSAVDADFQIVAQQGKHINIKDPLFIKIQQMPEVAHCNFILEENVLLNYNNKQTISTMRAVDDSYTHSVHLDSNIIRGIYATEINDTPYVIPGLGLAYQLGIDPDDMFNKVGMYAPKIGDVDLLNPTDAFTRKSFAASGIFSIQDEIDAKYILLPLNAGQELIEVDSSKASYAEIRLKNSEISPSFQDDIQRILPTKYLIKSRYQLRESFYKVMKSERFISFMILFFIMIIASFNTIGSMYMVALDKQHDLQIFRAMGLMPKQAAQIFVIQSILLAFIGCVIGFLLSIIIILLQQKYGIIGINGDTFSVSAYPVRMKVMDFVYVFGCVILLGLITSIFPARKAHAQVSQ